MLPPHELKNKSFTRVIRGYNSAEVDEHINFIVQKYTELYRENDELERKLKTATAKLEQFKNDEESIRSALINAQRASSKIMNEANDRADMIVRSAKTNCDKIIADFRVQIKKERDTLYKLRQQVAQFKARTFEQYRTHIEFLESISPDIDDSAEWAVADDEYTRKAIENVKSDVAKVISTESKQAKTDVYEKPDENIFSASAEQVNVSASDAADNTEKAADADTAENKNAETADEVKDVAGTAEADNDSADSSETKVFKIQREPVNASAAKPADKDDVKNATDSDTNKSNKPENDAGVRNAIMELNKMLADDEPEKAIDQDDLLSALTGEIEKDKVISDDEILDGATTEMKVAGKNTDNHSSKKDKKHKLSTTQEFELVYGINNDKNKK